MTKIYMTENLPQTAPYPRFDLVDVDGFLVSQNISEREAREIVRAVNSHTTLVAALEKTLAALRLTMDLKPIEWAGIMTPELANACDHIKDALAQAKGQPS